MFIFYPRLLYLRRLNYKSHGTSYTAGVRLVKVSVIVPVYNESKSIVRLSKALKSQGFKDMEIV